VFLFMSFHIILLLLLLLSFTIIAKIIFFSNYSFKNNHKKGIKIKESTTENIYKYISSALNLVY
jgi:hypothetical protein